MFTWTHVHQKPSRSSLICNVFSLLQPILTLVLLLPLLAGLICSQSQAQAAAQPLMNAQSSMPAADLLRPDGTLDLSRGVNGIVDVNGWNMRLDPTHGPILTSQSVAGTWHALDTGLNHEVYAIAVSGNDVYVGGQFTDAGGDVNADWIARWDGTTWHALGTGPNSYVLSIAVSGSDVYVGGWLNDVDGIADADYIARWDGTARHALSTRVNDGVFAIAVNGRDIYVGGGFTDAGGNAHADYIARYGSTTYRVHLPIALQLQ